MWRGISKLFLVIIFLSTLSFNVKLLTSNQDFNIFGIEVQLNNTDVQAENEQKYKMSVGPGCICGSVGDYWVSCHLPSALNECSIMPCECFEIPK